jgi:hypothetical protein
MRVVGVGIVDQNQQPVYLLPVLRKDHPEAVSAAGLSQYMYASLDAVEERTRRVLAAASAAGAKRHTSDAYLGPVYAGAHGTVYAHTSSARITALLLARSDTAAVREPDVRALLFKLLQRFVYSLCNPFHGLGDDALESPAFDADVRRLLDRAAPASSTAP